MSDSFIYYSFFLLTEKMVGLTGDIFVEVGLVIIFAAVAAYLLRIIRQPQLLAYVIVGVLVTPIFKIVTDTTIVESMSVIGIAFLLFIVGLEMDVKALRNVALVSTLGGAIQTIILVVTGYFIALLLGFLSLEAAYLGLVLAFSSTMVVMKLLSDKRELNTLHGRIAVGILLVQDIVAIFALSMLATLDNFNAIMFLIAVLKFLILFAVAYLASRFIFPITFKFAARKQELLLISSLAVCFVFSFLALKIGEVSLFFLQNPLWAVPLTQAMKNSLSSGFSIAIGAFVGGLSLASLEYNFEIIGKMKSLKDFFALLFFVALGMGVSLVVLQEMWLELVVLLLVILILKPFIIMLICSLFKYTKKPSFFTANSLAQVGEFSLILVAQGLALGHVSQEIFSLTVIATIISIVFTSYYIEYGQFFYKMLEKPLRIFDKFTTEGLEYLPSEVKPRIILCGHNRIGYSILRDLGKVKKKVLVIDYNPEVISRMVDEGYHCIYGEVTDDEVIERMNLKHAKIVISTVPELAANIFLMKKIREVNKRAKVMVTADDIDQALILYEHGADYVILPHFLGGEHVSNLVTKVRSKKLDLVNHRKHHIKHLQERKDLGHEHPKNHK